MSRYTKGTDSYVGITFFEVLTVVFIVLKLLGKISWPWIWVLAPTWIPLLILLVFILIVLIKTRR